MTASLVEILKEICDSSYGQSRLDNYFNALEEWKQRNNLVDRVINREASFYGEVERFYDKYGGARLLYPNTIADEDLEDVSMLLEVFGYIVLHTSDIHRSFMNPTANAIYMGTILGSIGGFAAYAQTSNPNANKKYLKQKKENPDMTRRDFIIKSAKKGLLIGGIIGFLAQSIKNHRIESAIEEDALFLDRVVYAAYSGR